MKPVIQLAQGAVLWTLVILGLTFVNHLLGG